MSDLDTRKNTYRSNYFRGDAWKRVYLPITFVETPGKASIVPIISLRPPERRMERTALVDALPGRLYEDFFHAPVTMACALAAKLLLPSQRDERMAAVFTDDLPFRNRRLELLDFILQCGRLTAITGYTFLYGQRLPILYGTYVILQSFIWLDARCARRLRGSCESNTSARSFAASLVPARKDPLRGKQTRRYVLRNDRCARNPHNLA
jgi:hypothetical protein